MLLRLPSFLEPPWHTDEGIFAAVAQRVLSGGGLYSDAWESKPPLFLYLYVAVLKVFGPGIFGLRFMATLFAVGTHVVLFFIALRFMSTRRALAATALTGLLLGVPFWEGTLALTETFTVLPAALGVLCVLLWDEREAAAPIALLRGGSEGVQRPARPPDGSAPGQRGNRLLLVVAGAFFGIAFLLRQTSIAAPAAAGIWFLLRGRPVLRPGLISAAAFAAIVVPVVGGFELFGDSHWFWDANVGFFFKYVPSGQQLPFGTRPVIVLPFLIVVAALWLARRRQRATPEWGLPALWLTLTLAGALLTGRPYPHYLLQTFPPLAMLVAMAAPALQARGPHPQPPLPHGQRGLSEPAQRRRGLALPRSVPAYLFVAALAFEWFYVVVPMFGGNAFAMHYTRGPSYYANFAGWAVGLRSDQAYDDYFDRRVAFTRSLDQTLERLDAEGQKVYIWGEYPWVYPLARIEPATRYMTSFYVLLLPYLDVQLAGTLNQEKPVYIVVMSDAKPKLPSPSPIIERRWNNAIRGLKSVIARDYQHVATVGRAQIYRRSPERLTSTPNSGVHILYPAEDVVGP